MSKIKDNLEELKLEAHREQCEHEPEPKCQYCQDTNIETKTEWVNDDDSYEVEKPCRHLGEE